MSNEERFPEILFMKYMFTPANDSIERGKYFRICDNLRYANRDFEIRQFDDEKIEIVTDNYVTGSTLALAQYTKESGGQVSFNAYLTVVAVMKPFDAHKIITRTYDVTVEATNTPPTAAFQKIACRIRGTIYKEDNDVEICASEITGDNGV